MDLLLKLAIVVSVGCLAGKLAKTIRLSNIFGFVIAGLILGPSCLKLLSEQNVASLAIISEVTVAILAFKIGSEFVLRDMRKLGNSFVVVTFFEVTAAFLLVFSAMFFLFKQGFAFSMVMASIAAATAPAAAIMVIRQYRSDGPLTRMLLPVTALDGVLGVFLFGFAISIARVSIQALELSTWQMLLRLLFEVFGSLALGAVLGLALSFFGQRAGDSDELLVITIATILASTSIAKVLVLSPLLTNIIMGAVLVNLTQNSNRVFFSLNNFTPPLYLLFFMIAGASVSLSSLTKIALLSLVYIASRALGKLLGAWIGAKNVRAEVSVQKYLGTALLPQGGLTIALGIFAGQYLPELGVAIVGIIVVSVLLYEMVGPIIAKAAIEKAGEIRKMGSVIR